MLQNLTNFHKQFGKTSIKYANFALMFMKIVSKWTKNDFKNSTNYAKLCPVCKTAGAARRSC